MSCVKNGCQWLFCGLVKENTDALCTRVSEFKTTGRWRIEEALSFGNSLRFPHNYEGHYDELTSPKSQNYPFPPIISSWGSLCHWPKLMLSRVNLLHNFIPILPNLVPFHTYIDKKKQKKNINTILNLQMHLALNHSHQLDQQHHDDLPRTHTGKIFFNLSTLIKSYIASWKTLL